MTDLNNKRASLIRLEFWGLATIFVFGLMFFLAERLGDNVLENAPYKAGFDKIKMPFHYYENYLIPVVIEFIFEIAAFWTMNFYLVPRLVKKEALVKNISLLIIVFVSLGLVDLITDTYIHAYRYNGNDANEQVWFLKSFVSPVQSFVVFGVYSLLKYTGLYFISNSKAIEDKYRFVQRDGINAFVVWMLSLFILIVLGAERGIAVAWAISGPIAILIYWYSFYSLIPNVIGKRNAFLRYLLKIVLLQVILIFPVMMLAVPSMGDEGGATVFTAFNFVFQIVVTAPVTWALFKRYLKGNEEMFVLQKELGRSNAKLDFLRSQINPHFLFNALNTIYGTAIQEKAERTSEGIEKLGDMMRFMLQENMQEKISLAREVDYLNNYISLQKLRTDPHPNIQIDTHIADQIHTIQIAPMLLIPFVENAFKHGISFREPSNIKVALDIKEKNLYFDVANTKHAKQDNDPEKDKSGIGLNNVKQRLQLLYKNKHELIIRETAKDFYVHLTLQLS